MAGAAQLPDREMTEIEFRHICHRYHIARRMVENRSVLDVGCGAGLGLTYLAQTASRVVGTDLFAENIQQASKSEGPKVATHVMDAHHLQFKDGTFDVILAMEVVQYLRLDDFLTEVYRVLRPGGEAFICLPNPDRPEFTPGIGTIHYPTAGELRERLLAHGFEARICGAFLSPGVGQQKAETLKQTSIRWGVRLLDLLAPILPVRRIKDAVRRLIHYKPIRLKAVLTESDMAPILAITPEDIHELDRDPHHVFLYAFARRMI